MTRKTVAAGAAASAVAAAALSAALATGAGPPAPRAVSGAKVEVVGTGVPTPTAFAFGQGRVFVAGYGSEDGKTPGGIFVLRQGDAVRIPGTLGSAGLAWRGGSLFGTTAPRSLSVVAYSGWNGRTFSRRRVVFAPPRRFPGVNGLAFNGLGRLFVGVSLTSGGDHNKSFRPYANSIISMRKDGSDVRTVATGLRQPWQLTFAKRGAGPYVTVLGQENLGRRQPPDYVIRARPGDNYGFPACNWSKPAACAKFAKPIALLPAHSSPTGIAAHGSILFVGLFNGSQVIAIPASGGKWKPVLTGFPAPVVAVGYSGGYLYAGDLTGSIYRVRA